MNRGAEAASKTLGITVDSQAVEAFGPVLDVVTARAPDAILIAPADTTQMIEPLPRAHEQGIMVLTVDIFIDDGNYRTGAGGGDFPVTYVASDNLGGGRMAAPLHGKSDRWRRSDPCLKRASGYIDHGPA